MEDDNDKVPVPMGDLRVKIEQLAAKLTQLMTEKGATAMINMREKLVREKLPTFPFLGQDHPYFLYFETKLREFKATPALMPTFAKKDETAAAGPAAAGAKGAAEALTEQEVADRKERAMREEQLAQAAKEAKRDRTDPYPSLFTLHMPAGVTISRPVYDVMCLSAQCAAKAGNPFSEQISKSYAGNKLFSFLSVDDPAHRTYLDLVDSYRRILNYVPNEVQDRLEVYERPGAKLQEVFTAKGNFLTAEAARTKAAVLTDDELRKRLQWSTFVVQATFTAEHFGLAATQPTAIKGPDQTAVTSVVPSGAIGWGDESDNAAAPSTSSATDSAAYVPEVVGIAKRSGNSEYVKDPSTGELVHISQLQKRGGGGGSLFGTDGSTAPVGGGMGQKREREENGLASYASFEANLRK